MKKAPTSVKNNNYTRLVIAGSRLLLGIVTIAFFLYYFVDGIKKVGDNDTIDSKGDLVVLLSDFVVQSILERGLSILWIMDTSDDDGDDHFLKSDLEKIQNVTENLRISLIGRQNVLGDLEFMEVLNELPQFQKAVLNRTIGGVQISGKDVSSYFDNLLEKLFSAISRRAFFNSSELTNAFQNWIYFNRYLELLGRECNIVFTRNVLDRKFFFTSYFGIIQNQAIALTMFKIRATQSDLQKLEEIESNNDYQLAYQFVLSTREMFKLTITDHGIQPNTSISEWWDNLTIIINNESLLNRILLSDIKKSTISYKYIHTVFLAISVAGMITELMVAIQLFYVAIPVFRLWLLWEGVVTPARKSKQNLDGRIQE